MTEERESIDLPPARAPDGTRAPRVRTLLICDLAESTALVERLGDTAGADLIRRHDRAARDLIQRHGGREIDKTDGFLALFDRPVEAVAFALAYQRALQRLGSECNQSLRARVGIHVGEVVVWENSSADIDAGAKRVDVEGLAKPVVARLMALALPGQIVLSGVAFSLAQRAERELDASLQLRWLTHGRYRFKGVAAPMLVHEVGESGFAPLQAPPSSGKAERDVPLWRKPGVLALEAIALLAAIAVPVALSLRSPPAIAFAERDWVVVGDLRNLTGDAVLDESLETAFRISLEQSRFVNVLPDMKLRDTLARMKLESGTVLDRNVASEIAMREGARAVVLPTVAEVGGRVRVSAEIIDPHTQTTVYAESADGLGTGSTLDSIDTVTHNLRARLGEALAAIEQDSAPLPQVTSASLDALRAYAIGVQHFFSSEYREALASYDHALGIDPDFALAHIGRARVWYSLDDQDQARAALARATELTDRLTNRDSLYLAAWSATFGPTEEKLERWQLLSTVYPDFFAANYNYALFAMFDAGRYQDAIDAVTRADVSQDPYQSEMIYLRGTGELALNRIEDALASFHRSVAMRPSGRNREVAFAFAVKRDYEAAQAVLAKANVPDSDAQRRDRLEVDIAFAWDQGRIDVAAGDGGDAAENPPQGFDSAGGVLMGLMRATVMQDAEAGRIALDAALARFLSAVPGESGGETDVRGNRLLVTAYLAARLGFADDAQRALDAITPEQQDGVANRVMMREVVAAEILTARGEPAKALTVLDRLMLRHPPFQAHSARLRALLANDDVGAALEEARWLATSRGTAYVGSDLISQMRPLNLADSNLAQLQSAELLLRVERPAEIVAPLEQFLAHWPQARDLRPWSARVLSLQQALPPSS